MAIPSGAVHADVIGAAGPASAETKRIFAIPPTQWNNAMSTERPAHVFGPSDLGNLTGGIVFGLSPASVNSRLPTPTPGVEWGDLPFANEYPGDVRYFWVRLDALARFGHRSHALRRRQQLCRLPVPRPRLVPRLLAIAARIRTVPRRALRPRISSRGTSRSTGRCRWRPIIAPARRKRWRSPTPTRTI